MPNGRLIRSSTIRIALIAALYTSGGFAFGDSPKAPRILPDTTVAYLHIDDAQDLFKKLSDTAIGRMIRDDQVQPFFNHLYESAAEAFSGVEDELGLSLDRLLDIPQGEVCLALVPRDQGQPALIALVEVGDQLPTARKVVEYLQAKMVERGGLKGSETWRGTELTVVQESEESNSHVVFFERDKTIAVSTDLEVAKQVLTAWHGVETTSLADRREFITIMEQCTGSGEDEPQLVYFVRPIQLFKSVTAGNMALQVGVSILREMGLDGLQGFGGSLVLGGERFESVDHMVVSLDSSPTGVLEILALRPGDVTPEVWVPKDVATYMTLHWDFQKSYSALAEVYDFFRQEGGWARDVEGPVSERFGVNLKGDVLAALDGRITRIGWIDEGSRRQATLLGLKLKDAKAFRALLSKTADRLPSLFAKQNVADIDCYKFSPRSGTDNAGGVMRRLPDSLLAVLGDYLLLTDSEKLLERVVVTKNGESTPLGQELDFRLVASMIRRKAGGKTPNAAWFKRPEVRLRATYELLRSDDTRKAVAKLAENNRLFQAINEAMTEHPLPSFDVLEKYFAVSGGVATSDKTGIHIVGFTYRRK